MQNELLIATVIVMLTILFGSIIISENIRPKYEIKYLRGWWVIRDVKTKTHLRRFSTNEKAIEWYNENCL
jgi:hypothetical protein